MKALKGETRIERVSDSTRKEKRDWIDYCRNHQRVHTDSCIITSRVCCRIVGSMPSSSSTSDSESDAFASNGLRPAELEAMGDGTWVDVEPRCICISIECIKAAWCCCWVARGIPLLPVGDGLSELLLQAPLVPLPSWVSVMSEPDRSVAYSHFFFRLQNLHHKSVLLTPNRARHFFWSLFSDAETRTSLFLRGSKTVKFWKIIFLNW